MYWYRSRILSSTKTDLEYEKKSHRIHNTAKKVINYSKLLKKVKNIRFLPVLQIRNGDPALFYPSDIGYGIFLPDF
jgi:hypothetical protein